MLKAGLVLGMASLLLEALVRFETSVVVSSILNKDSVAHSSLVNASFLDEASALVGALVLVRASVSVFAEYHKEIVE